MGATPRQSKSIPYSTAGLLINVPPPPKDLDPIARETWEISARFLVLRKVLTTADIPTLRSYSCAVSNAREISDALKKFGAVSPTGKPSSLLPAANAASKAVKDLALVLGLVPFGRQSLPPNARDAIDDDTTTEASPLASMLKNRAKSRRAA